MKQRSPVAAAVSARFLRRCTALVGNDQNGMGVDDQNRTARAAGRRRAGAYVNRGPLCPLVPEIARRVVPDDLWIDVASSNWGQKYLL